MFSLETGKVRLNSGYDIPVTGLGIYALAGETCIRSVKAHLKYGGRLLDTAHMYGNEETVGQAVREAMKEYGIDREEIFVITKLYPNQYSDPVSAIESALAKMNTGYLDMLMLHHPGRNDVKTYLEMERYVKEGKIRSLGLSNWYIRELPDFLKKVNIRPSLVQNEIHPYYQENDVVPFIQKHDIAVQAWYPLGGRGYTKKLLSDPVLTEIAAAHGKSTAQIILRWHLQRQIIPIPGSSSPEHIRENLSVFDFELSDSEMEKIKTLNRNEKHDWY